MYANCMFRTKNGVLVLLRWDELEQRQHEMAHLASGVNDVTVVFYASIDYALGKCAFDSWKVWLDEMVLDELYDKRRLACRMEVSVMTSRMK